MPNLDLFQRPRPWRGVGRAFAEDDHPQHLVLGDLVSSRVPTSCRSSSPHPVREVEDVVDIVADQEDADALAS